MGNWVVEQPITQLPIVTMFRSKSRPIVIPQYEHGRLAGVLAQEWGNEQFERPPFNFASFVEGVTLHDWHYGFGDNLSIGEATEEEWVAVTRRGLTLRLADPIADVVMKFHLRRLCSHYPTPPRLALMAEFEELIQRLLPETGHSWQDFEWADRITRFCDYVAFHFAFEVERQLSANVLARVGDGAETAVSYHIQPQGQITIDPWPFAQATIAGAIIGYQADDYPELLRPLRIPFNIKSQTLPTAP